ncbi:Plug domain-containing protein [Ilyomonas limi]|uniref:Plug domain-containing protein n=1 Tax=Ilyomonas limi TaxID=2575867 RepID=A0A4U3LBC1_9BACT|nr:TonB-dependent receptor [Ilyomonas limi]TKK71794.1 Plug domain-containing protein [Ilyomonas limi]
MRKLLLLFSCIVLCKVMQAQKYFNPDTADFTERPDTIIAEELKDNVLDNIPTISLSDEDLSDAAAQNISSQLTAGRDPFYNAAAFNFSPARFRIRGYDGTFAAVYINGLPMDNLDDGYTPWGLWGGLNDVFRNREVNFGNRYTTFAFGDVGTNTNFDIRASKQRKQTSIGYALSNRNYTHRIILTHNTGLNKRGWAFSFSGSRRYADEGYIPGTYYNGWSWFAAVDKKLGQKQLLSFAAFAAPTENGRQTSATQEMMTLAGSHYYNPSWGYQNGKKRNANVAKTNQPVLLLTHEYRISNKTALLTAASYSFGERSISGIDWYNAPDPRPNYYRYLPSFYAADNSALAQQLTDVLSTNESARQINWNNLYNVNRDNTTTVDNANGIAGNVITDNRSFYILGERVTNVQRFTASTTINAKLSEHIDITGGISYQLARNNYFQRIADLLGGQFWIDLNQFAQRNFPNNVNAYQNDLNHPNRIVYKGDQYGYNYNININKPQEWAQLVFKFRKIDFFVAGEVSQTKFWRVGNVRNGLFPNNSYGKSEVHIFDNYAAKGGVTYKINGRNYLYINGALLTRAPYYDNIYVSPRTRDFVQDSLQSEAIKTIEGGYVLNAPNVKVRISGYYTSMKNGFNVLTFYHDQYQDFVNYALSHIDRLYFGGEFGIEAKVARNVTANAAAAIGRYYYNSRQKATVTVDNTADIVSEDEIYSKNYRIAGTPQEAYSGGITYRSPKFWFVSLTGNYFSQMWLDFNPLRRTYVATDGVTDVGSEKAHTILDQTRLDNQYTLDFYGGYSWRVKHTYIDKRALYVVINAGVNNLLNNTDIITGGYEQLRYDFSASSEQNLSRFPPKYYYAYGLNYFISLQVRF